MFHFFHWSLLICTRKIDKQIVSQVNLAEILSMYKKPMIYKQFATS